jgi:hypothetical protein
MKRVGEELRSLNGERVCAASCLEIRGLEQLLVMIGDGWKLCEGMHVLHLVRLFEKGVAASKILGAVYSVCEQMNKRPTIGSPSIRRHAQDGANTGGAQPASTAGTCFEEWPIDDQLATTPRHIGRYVLGSHLPTKKLRPNGMGYLILRY